MLRVYEHALNFQIGFKILLTHALSNRTQLSIVFEHNMFRMKLSQCAGNGSKGLLLAAKRSAKRAAFTTQNLTNNTNNVFARIDHNRKSRTNFPEVVFGETKKPGEIISILKSMMVSDILDEVNHPILATRVNEELWNEMLEVEEGNGVECSFDKNNYSLTYNKVANVVVLKPPPLPCDTPAAPQLSHVCVVTAGTTDIPVAEEAIAILEAVSEAKRSEAKRSEAS